MGLCIYCWECNMYLVDVTKYKLIFHQQSQHTGAKSLIEKAKDKKKMLGNILIFKSMYFFFFVSKINPE